MKARHVARELAFLCLSQFSKHPEVLDDKTLEDFILTSVRVLSEYAQSNLKNSLTDLFSIREFLYETEINDSKNLERPIDAAIIPVNIPQTEEMRNQIDKMIDSVEYIFQALEIAELTALSDREEVREYAIRLINLYINHQYVVEEKINQFSEGWNFDRLLKLDRSILAISIVEMMYIDEVPNEVSVDEAVEIAKKYSSDDSPKFINGVLGQVLSSFANA